MVLRPWITEVTELTKNKILCFLHFQYVNSDDDYFTEEELKEVITGLNSQIIRHALNQLRESIYAHSETLDEIHEFGYSISDEGIKYVDSWSDEKYEEVSQGIDFLEEEGEQDSQLSNETHPPSRDEQLEIPASDRIVTLDDNSQEYKETLNALRAVSAEAATSNELSELFADPEDRIVISSQVDSGIALIEAKKVIPDVVRRLLEPSLKFLKEKTPDATMGALASRALEWLAKLFENLSSTMSKRTDNSGSFAPPPQPSPARGEGVYKVCFLASGEGVFGMRSPSTGEGDCWVLAAAKIISPPPLRGRVRVGGVCVHSDARNKLLPYRHGTPADCVKTPQRLRNAFGMHCGASRSTATASTVRCRLGITWWIYCVWNAVSSSKWTAGSTRWKWERMRSGRAGLKARDSGSSDSGTMKFLRTPKAWWMSSGALWLRISPPTPTLPRKGGGGLLFGGAHA